MSLEQNTGIFCFAEDSSFFDYFFQKLNLNLSVYTDVDKFELSSHSTKIACLHMPYPYHPRVEQFVQQVECDKYIILCTELHNYIFNFIKRYDYKNITYFVNGEIDTVLQNAKIYPYMDWFRETADFYRENDFLNGLDNSPRDYVFECLLGRKKPHRDQVFEHVSTNNKVFTKYGTSEHIVDFKNSNEWITGLKDLVIKQSVGHSVNQIQYMNRTVRLSQLIPLEVYKKSYYSIVAETNTDSSFAFLTEKTAKPLIAGRLFLIAGNRYSLRTLHNLGFKTFDLVIDESYDGIDSQFKRIKSMLAQVDYLCTQDPESICKKIRPIVKHNQDLILNREWQQEFLQVFLSELETG